MYIEVAVEGVLPYSSSSVFISCFKKRNGQKLDIPIVVHYKWNRVVGGQKFKLENTSGGYFITALDVSSTIHVEITSLEDNTASKAFVTIGPVLLDRNLKLDLLDMVSQSEGVKIPLVNMHAAQSTVHSDLKNPVVYIFENYIKIIGQRSGEFATLRISFVDGINISSGKRGPNCFVLSTSNTNVGDFIGLNTDEGQDIELECEDTYMRDRAILSILAFSVIHNLRNELILQRVIALIQPAKEQIQSLMMINHHLNRELTQLYKKDRIAWDELQKAQENLYKARGFAESTIFEKKYMTKVSDIHISNPVSPSNIAYYRQRQEILTSDLNMSKPNILNE